jgi:class 3 adenylate cyclase
VERIETVENELSELKTGTEEEMRTVTILFVDVIEFTT